MIVVTGPESTGKSTLAQSLGEEFNLSLVPEANLKAVASRSTQKAITAPGPAQGAPL